MRRRRHVLQVSTFPFLAVLLCAMGALVLLLFIMDRRAKIVAQNRVRPTAKLDEPKQKPAVKPDVSDDKKYADEIQQWLIKAKFEQAKKAFDRIALARVENELRFSQLVLGQQQKTLHDQIIDLTTNQGELHAERTANDKLKRQYQRVTAELLQIKDIVRHLSNRPKKVRNTYSIVPYAGKRGDNRKPTYIEVTDNQLIFHPTQKMLTLGLGSLAQTILAFQQHVLVLAESQKPYVLFLVRPSGIVAYYRAQQIVRSLKIDFGYELIDGDWKLDYSVPVSAADLAKVRQGNGGKGKTASGSKHKGNSSKSGKQRHKGGLGGKPGGAKKKMRITRHIDNKDFVITVDCLKDTVVVYPGGRRFATDSFWTVKNAKHPACQMVQEWIQRRQATLAIGEAPYRPRILFRVSTEGRRSYFLAYPVFGTLRLPMEQTKTK